MIRCLTCASLLLLVAACGDPTPGTDAGSPLDAGSEPRDAGATDTGLPLADSGTADRDGDGVPDGGDCAPDDPAVGATSSRPCDRGCGAGVEACTGGVWGACSAPSDCTCDTPGMRRVVTCGMCGMVSEECMDGRWQSVSMCLNEGECMPGAVEDRDQPRCQVDQRICAMDCEWGEWSTIVPAGRCEAGEVGHCFIGDDYLCTSECMLVDNPECP